MLSKLSHNTSSKRSEDNKISNTDVWRNTRKLDLALSMIRTNYNERSRCLLGNVTTAISLTSSANGTAIRYSIQVLSMQTINDLTEFYMISKSKYIIQKDCDNTIIHAKKIVGIKLTTAWLETKSAIQHKS